MKNLSITDYASAPSTLEGSDATDIFRLDSRHTVEASHVLSEAFTGYPVANYMFEGLDDGPSRFRVMFEYLINSRLVRKWPVFGCRLDDEIVGVAVVSEPGEEWSTPELDAQWDRACEAMGEQAIDRFLEYAEACDEGLPSWPHHYLGILGVKPVRQGFGIGKRLVEAVKANARQHAVSKGICLNTEASGNLPFYRNQGFEVIDSRPVGTIHTWCLAKRV